MRAAVAVEVHTITDIVILDILIPHITHIPGIITIQATIAIQAITLLGLFLAYHLDIDLPHRTYIIFPWESVIDFQGY